MNITIALALLLVYFFGAIPFGFIAGKLCGVDVRSVGSGNIGTTNVWRTLGPKVGVAVFALDVLKGLAGPVIGRLLLPGNEAMIAVCAVVAVLGHVFSVFLKFKGGKGIATALGAIIGLSPVLAIIVFTTWGIVLFASRMISVASILACFVVGISAWVMKVPVPSALVMTVMALLALVKHVPNMKRIAAGTEPKILQKKDGHIELAPDDEEVVGVEEKTNVSGVEARPIDPKNIGGTAVGR